MRVNERKLSFILASILIAACAFQVSHTYKLYSGPERSAEEIATLDLSGVDVITVDGLNVKRMDYARVQLFPGEHRITSAKEFGFSVLVEPSMHGRFERILEVNLEAGKVYKVIGDRTTGHGYQIFFWIEEANSGEVVAGEKKP